MSGNYFEVLELGINVRFFLRRSEKMSKNDLAKRKKWTKVPENETIKCENLRKKTKKKLEMSEFFSEFKCQVISRK